MFLNVEFDSCLTWQPHITKLGTSLYAMRTLSNFHTLLQVYFTFCQTHISYDLIFWRNIFDSIKVFQIQTKVIRSIAQSPFNDPCRQHFRYLKILTLPSSHIFRYLLFAHSNSGKILRKKNTLTHNSLENFLFLNPQNFEQPFLKQPSYRYVNLLNLKTTALLSSHTFVF